MAAGPTTRRLPPRRAALAAAFLVSLIAFSLYRSTLLPGMGLGDTPSFQIMGGSPVISPRDAYPLYFALAAPFVRWIGPDPAHAMNLASAAAAATACGVLLLVGVEISGSIGAATVAALAFAGSYTFWSQAVIAEVYALHMLCVAIVLRAALAWQRRPTTARLTLLLASYALSFGNHLTMILLLPGLAILLAGTSPDGVRMLVAPRTVAVGLFCALAGALPYLWNLRTLLAEPTPPRDAVEAARWFWFDVTKSDWRDTMLMTFPRDMAAERLRMLRFDIHQQYGWLFVWVSALGLVTLARSRPVVAALLGAWLVCNTAFALTYNVGDPHVFLLPTHLVLALLAAPGLAWLGRRLSTRLGRAAGPLVATAALALMLARIVGEYPALDRSGDRRAILALDALTSDLDDRRAVLLADLNWQLQNGLNYYGRILRNDLTFAEAAQVLPYALTLIRDNHAIGRDVVLAGRTRADVEAAYGPLIPTRPDDRRPAAALDRRAATLEPGSRYVLCFIKPTPDAEWDPSELDRTVSFLTGGRLTRAPAEDFMALAGLVGAPPVLVRHEGRPFRTNATLDGVPVLIRMEAWLPFDTIRRMGFGHVISRRHHALIVERGVSLVALGPDGQPIRVEYAAGIYAPVPRFIVERAH